MTDVRTVDTVRNMPQYLLPKRLLTRCTYKLTRIRAGWFKNGFIRLFIRLFQVNMSEAAVADPTAYEHFNAFFTRALKPGARPLSNGPGELCCPVDGAVSQCGAVTDGDLFQAKGRHYSLTALLGGDTELAGLFQDGSFATIYLSPRDYHRIHMPLAGTLTRMIHVPGQLFSVSPLTTRMVPDLFARNERLVTIFDTAAGTMALVMVGAVNVASMETVWAGEVTPPLGSVLQVWNFPGTSDGPDNEAVKLTHGAEMGRFNMGSTVILVFASGRVSWDQAIVAGAPVRLGQRLAAYVGGSK